MQRPRAAPENLNKICEMLRLVFTPISLPHHGVEGRGVDMNPVQAVAVLLCQADGPVRVDPQPEEQHVDSEGGADEEYGEQDEREGLALYPGASGVKLPHHHQTDNEAEQALVGEVCRDVDPGGPHH